MEAKDKGKVVGKVFTIQIPDPIQVKPILTTSTTKGKRKGVHVEPSEEEKKKLQDLEIEKMKQLNNTRRLTANDPPSLNKGDPNKVWCYEAIENIAYGKVDVFRKRPKRNYHIRNVDFNQLDFSFNHLMFIFAQFKLAENFHNSKEYKSMKIQF
ncbi:unnamed protein product [Lactuca saligna]|uniref:Uncharacterized protein n=1 Tax=Lactuca saligna TaxID=75948 RepID=A0AA36E7S2_LACSI|nr:unnamed protein product [Lactuca saligna]